MWRHVSLFAACAHVGHQLVAETMPWEFLALAGAAAVVGFAVEVHPSPRAVARSVPVLAPLAGASVARICNVSTDFAVAHVAAFFLLFWVRLAQELDLAKYDTRTAWFTLSRTTSYAALRASTAALVRHAGMPVRLARLAPALAGTIETCGMIARGSDGSYNFDSQSTRFHVYAVLKLAALLALPALEDAAFLRAPQP